MKFKNQTTLDKKLIRETYFPSVSARKNIGALCSSFFAMFLFLAFVWWCLNWLDLITSEHFYIFAIPATLSLLILFPLSLRESHAKHRVKEIRAISGKESATRTAEFYEDHFVWTSSETGNVRTVAYSSLHKFFETKHYFNFVEGVGLYSIAKDGFTVGTADDFRAFMQEIVDENNRKK